MIYRYVCQQWRPKRYNSSAILNPVLQGKIFSQRKTPENVLAIPKNTYPNPLYGYDKKQLLSLNIKEIKHLLTLPARSVSETDSFHRNIVEIVHENLIKDTKLAVLYLDLITEPSVRKTILQYLHKSYESDSVRSSVLAYIEDPTTNFCRQAVQANLAQILDNPDPDSAATLALNYIKMLAVTDRVKPEPIFLSKTRSRILYRYTPKEQRQLLYSALMQTNIRFGNHDYHKALKNHLLKGSMLDRFVARTGILDPKWHDTEKVSFSETQKQKMVIYFSVQEFAFFTQQSIRQKDVTNANLYLELMVSKFELLNDPAHLQLVLSVMLSHSMAFKGPQECLHFLRYIIKSNFRIVPDTLLRILTALRLNSFYDEALLLVNYLHTEKLSCDERISLVAEIMKIITGKFSHHPKIAVGYFASLFNDEKNGAMHLLKDLLLLDLIYGPGSTESSFSMIQKAEIHEDLKNSTMTHANLREIYSITLRSLPQDQKSSPVLIEKLYGQYRSKLGETTAKIPAFNERNVDETIVTLFLDHLLREDPEARDNLNLVHDRLKFETAKSIVNDFLGTQGRSNCLKGTYIFDLVITSSLLKHQDLAFSVGLFKKARDLGLPITFNQVNPFILHHYQKNEMERAQMWFMLLMRSGAKAKSSAADNVFRIAKEQNWTNTGSHYRNNVRIKVREARQEMQKLKAGAVDGNGNEGDTNMGEELEQILHELAIKRKKEEEDKANI